MDRPRRCAWLSLLAAVAPAAFVASASAADVSSSFTPSALSGSPPYNITYNFQLSTGAAPEQLIFAINGPELAKATISGAASVNGTQLESSTAISRCPGNRGTTATNIGYSAAYSLMLPAASVSTLTVAATRTTPLALGEGLGYAFSLGPDFGSLKPVSVADPQLGVPRMVPLTITARRARGGRVLVKGTTTPLLAGRQIALRYTASWPPRWKPLAQVRVRGDGTFAYTRFRPRRPGVYTVKPFYRSGDARFLSSSPACGATVKLR